MSSSQHDDHHLNEKKPVAFTVPLIMASVLIFVIVMFLSLCDPKQHHAGEAGHDGHMAPTEANHQEATAKEQHATTVEEPAMQKETESAETTVPSAEPAPAHH